MPNLQRTEIMDKYSVKYPNSMIGLLSKYGPPMKDEWLRRKVGPGIPSENNSLEKFCHTFKRTLMQTTLCNTLYLKEAINFISSQSKLECRSLSLRPLDPDCDPPKHVLFALEDLSKVQRKCLLKTSQMGFFQGIYLC